MPTVDSVVDSVGDLRRFGGNGLGTAPVGRKFWLGKKMVGNCRSLVFALKMLIVIGWGFVHFCWDGMMDFLRSLQRGGCDVMVCGETTLQTIESQDLF